MFNESTDIDIASSIGEASRVEAANECLLVMAEEELEVERQARHAVEGEREVLQRFGVASVVQSVKSEMKATESELNEMKATESEMKALKRASLAMKRNTQLLKREAQTIRRANQSMELAIEVEGGARWQFDLAQKFQCMVVIVSLWAQLLHYLDPEFGTSPCLYCDL